MGVRRKKLLIDALKYLLLICGTFVMVIPFAWMISTSFKQTREIFVFPPVWIPSEPTLRAYERILTNNRLPFMTFFLNSVKVTAVVVFAQVLTSASAGYVFARLRFKGSKQIFLCYLATMMIPVHATLVPLFMVMKQFHLIDSHMSLILPNLVTAFGTFLLKQFFETIPISLEEAAKIDGCMPGSVFLRIAMPLSKPALATLSIFVMIGTWNDYIRPLVFLNTLRQYTLPMGLSLMKGTFTTDWAVLMAGTCLAVLPVLLAYVMAQDYFVKGVTLSGIK